jgi:hypothetical protein
MGIQAAADTLLVLKKDSDGVVLHGRGKDLADEIEKAMIFDRETCRWKVLGPVDEVRLSDERRAIINVLRQVRKPMGPSGIAEVLGKPSGSVRKMLMEMCSAGQIQKASRGLYSA